MDTGHSPFLSSWLGSQVWGTVPQCPEAGTENYILENSKLKEAHMTAWALAVLESHNSLGASLESGSIRILVTGRQLGLALGTCWQLLEIRAF